MSSVLTRKNNRYLFVAMGVAFLLALVVQLPLLRDPLLIEKDFRNFYLVFRLQEPGLFPGQSLTDLEIATPLYTLLLWGAARVMSPALFSKLLVFPLLLLCVYFVFRIGERLRGPGVALAMSLGFTVFNLAANTEVAVTAGVQRSFAVPLLLALLYLLMQGRRRAAIVVVLLTGLIYLPLLPVTALTAALALFLRRDESGWHLDLAPRRLLVLALSILVILAAVSPFLMTTVQERLMTGLEAIQEGRHILVDPHYQPGGRAPIFVIFPFTGRAGLVSGGSTFIQFLILGALALLVFAVRRDRRRRLPPAATLMLFASMAAFVLSWFGLLLTSSFILYLPSRHTEGPLFVLLVLFVFLNIDETLQDLAGAVEQRRRLLVALAVPVVLLAAVAVGTPSLSASGEDGGDGWQTMRIILLLLILLLLPLFWLVRRRKAPVVPAAGRAPANITHVWIVLGAALLLMAPIYVRAAGPDFYKPSEEELALYDFLSTLPVDVTIAGDPCSLDDVHYYARRNVLYSCWRFDRDSEAVMNGLEAYYAEDPGQVADFCEAYDVDVLVADETTLAANYLAENQIFYEPYNSRLKQRLEGRRDFVLARMPPAERLFQSGEKFVVACSSE